MHELRFMRTDGDYLVFENADGEAFRIAVDETIRRAVKPVTPASASNFEITPREIQLEIRGGTGIAELAQRSGASVEYIQKFAAPVLDELAHVVQTALSVRLTVAGDRYSDTVQIEFGELIAERLSKSGISEVSWSSFRPENGEWTVVCDLGDTSAVWSFDLRKLTLSPENELAVQLSASQSFSDAPIPKLKQVSPNLPAAFAKAGDAEPVLSATGDLGDTLEFEGVIPFGRTKQAGPAEPMMGENLANTADLLDALRKKRMEREAAETEVISLNSEEVAVEESLETEAEASQVAQEPEAKPSKKGRAAVPSWNDIVFGTKTESDD